MNIYEYKIDIFGGFRRKVREGFTEKPRTYMRKEHPRKIHKDDIGRKTESLWGSVVFLLEDDAERAKAILIEFYSKEITEKTREHQEKIEELNNIIEKIKSTKF